MMADGQLIGDGSWELHVTVTDLQVERILRVKSDLHIGGVMLRLVEELDIAVDWSDHALWWPKKNMWLTHTRSTLDQYGVGAAAQLEFTPMHKNLRVQLPDLRYMDFRVDFSIKTFNAVVQLCKQLGIRYPEELSFCKPITQDNLKYNYSEKMIKKKSTAATKNGTPADTNSFIANQSHNSSNGSLDRSAASHHMPNSPTRTPIGSPTGTWRFNSNGVGSLNNTIDSIDGSDEFVASLANSPIHPSEEARNRLVRPKSLLERARMNVAWLDSSLSIMEQGVREFDTLLLRFKFFSFYDLNPKYDAVRINLIFEQAKWAIMNEEIDCTEEEMLMFAALQLQVNLQVNQPQPDMNSGGEDDIDRALSELQMSLEGSHVSSTPADIMHIPELADYLKFMKPRRFTLKGFKQYWFTCKDMNLCYYKTSDGTNEDPIERISLRGCEVTPDVNISQQRYGIKLEVPASDGMTDYLIRCSSEEQYARWMAAMRLASKGKSLADSSYDSEVKSILAFLSMQHPAPAPVINPESLDIQPELYLAPRFVRRIRGKAVQRILEAHANVKDLPLTEAKLQYIRAWQALPEYGIALFLVKHMGHKREELLGVAFNRIMRMEPNTGDHIKTWRYNTMKAWNVNWETRHMMIQFEEENVVFSCLTADCKVVHEFIGGYIFLSMRTKDANQNLNDELFHKLTGGWV
ncbi:unc-112-related protein-like isoform X1 [Penaeus monodon]|uniref:unc-112-related protein-like isoform X1 n=1 Tax=Penaeus monodon TaxID=6687 RepID=UPI0018A7709E|nr:unc-112-related protein-like isoform X1 [Penaeus monodon]XP_037801106.1 unc-112-related protein-like isoform X1 [Penaeus monodon]